MAAHPLRKWLADNGFVHPQHFSDGDARRCVAEVDPLADLGEQDAIRRLAQAADVFLAKVGGTGGGRLRRYDVIRAARTELENELFDVVIGLDGFDPWPDPLERTRRIRGDDR